MKIGIIGLPGSGKSTVFNLLAETFEGVDYSQDPTKPRVRTVKVRDPRLERLRDDYQPKKYTPAGVELLDFPGVASTDEDRSGLTDILQPAREMDALLIVLRAFAAPGQASGAPAPLKDLASLRAELLLTDLVITDRRLEKLAEKSRKPSFTDDDRREQALLERVKVRLEEEKPLTDLGLSAEDARRLAGFCFLSGKPFVTVLSTEGVAAPGQDLATIQSTAGGEVISVPARNELEILSLSEEDRAPFLEEYGIREFQRDRIISAAYRAAGLISFFTAGDKEVRAWTIHIGDTAPKAAGAIHSDFERGFIRAEVVSFDDYVKFAGVKGAKEKGRYRLEGREYVVQEADIVEFRFSV